jgi:hypothetical protein
MYTTTDPTNRQYWLEDAHLYREIARHLKAICQLLDSNQNGYDISRRGVLQRARQSDKRYWQMVTWQRHILDEQVWRLPGIEGRNFDCSWCGAHRQTLGAMCGICGHSVV